MIAISIIKIIAFAAVSVLLLAVLILLMLLFIPFRYSADFSFIGEKLNGGAKLSWLFAYVKAGYDSSGLNAGLYIFGHKIYDLMNNKDDRNLDNENAGNRLKDYKGDKIIGSAAAGEDTGQNKSIDNQKNAGDKTEDISKENAGGTALGVGTKDKRKRKNHDGAHKFKNNILKKLRAGLVFIVSKLKGIFIKIKNNRNLLSDIAGILREERYKDSIDNFKAKVFSVLYELKPKKGTGYVRYGSDDPYNTGQVMQIAAILYPLYAENIEVIPDFGGPSLEADIDISGRLRLYVFLKIFLSLFLDKKLKQMVSRLKRLLSEPSDADNVDMPLNGAEMI